MSEHQCNAITLTCIDWRLHPQTELFYGKEYGRFDACMAAGSVKDLLNPATAEYWLRQIEISCSLHDPRFVALTMHADCGAYGGLAAFGGKREREREHHVGVLGRVREIICQRFPQLEPQLFFLDLIKRADHDWECRPYKI